MSESKKYEIDSFKKLCNVVNTENAQRLAIDLGQWLIYYAIAIGEIRAKHPKETKNKTNSQIAEGHFTWIDDGKNDLLYSEIINKDTGEVTTISHEKINREQNHERGVATKSNSSTDDDKQK